MNKKAHQLPAGQEWVKQHTGVYSYLAVPPACRVNLILVATEAILNKVTHHNSSLLQGQQLGQKSLVLLKLPSVDRDMLGVGCQVFHQNADKVPSCSAFSFLCPFSFLTISHDCHQTDVVLAQVKFCLTCFSTFSTPQWSQFLLRHDKVGGEHTLISDKMSRPSVACCNRAPTESSFRLMIMHTLHNPCPKACCLEALVWLG